MFETFLKIFSSFIIIIAIAKIFGLFFRVFRQSSIVGEFVGGIFIGTIFFRSIFFESPNLFFSNFTLDYINKISQYGLLIYLFLLGLELNVSAIKPRFKNGIFISIGGFVFSLVFGMIVANYLYFKKTYFLEAISHEQAIWSIGIAFTFTALPVLSRILEDKKILNTEIGLTTMTAVIFGDIMSWLSFGLLFIFVQIETTKYLGLMLIFLGILLAKRKFFIKFRKMLSPLINFVYFPIFFASAGLKIGQISFEFYSTIWVMVLMITMAIMGRMIGSGLLGYLLKIDFRSNIGISLLLNVRGIVEVVAVTLLLENHIITQKLFAMLIIMTIATTAISPLFFDLFFSRKYSWFNRQKIQMIVFGRRLLENLTKLL